MTAGHRIPQPAKSRLGSLDGYALHGYAIVSANGMIADADGRIPDSLRNDADWAYFQGELDLARLVMLGRLSHEVTPNPKRRRRLVASSGVAGLEQRPDAWWWNPNAVPLAAALERIVPGGGRIAVPGGQGLFDLFIAEGGFDHFHLARAIGVEVPDGRPIFSATARGVTVESVLIGAGMRAGPTVTIDPKVPVELTVWRRDV
jgi:dihydrofolate reductase